VVNLSGRFVVLCTAITTAGLAAPAAQPHTELIITKVVPSLFRVLSTSSGKLTLQNHYRFNSAFIGVTISVGYMLTLFLRNANLEQKFERGKYC
jgi:hypothetical protein